METGVIDPTGALAGSDPGKDPDDDESAATALTHFEGRALGSTLKLFLRFPPGVESAASIATSDRAWGAIQAEFAAVDAALSRFRDDSELTALNRLAGSGGVALVSWRLRTMLATVDRARRVTDGRFDATVLDVLERIGEVGADLAPRPAAGRAVRDDRVALAPASSVRASLVRIPKAPVDSGGIGKGLALRWAAAAAIQLLPEGSGVLIDSGGDVMGAGVAPDGGWRVGVDDPFLPDGAAGPPLAIYSLDRGGISTSSVATRNWISPAGRHVHHLVDPATREPARTGLVAVSVAGPDPAWNEVWSKALFMGGRESIGEEARRRGLAVWWVDDRGKLRLTPEARVRSVWICEERL